MKYRLPVCLELDWVVNECPAFVVDIWEFSI